MDAVTAQYVEVIPSDLQDGIIYVSERYQTATHRCCCGCGNRVVTPLKAGGWTLRTYRDTISLSPSIGNWNFPCQSHYWIHDSRIVWSPPLTERQIARNQARDREDLRSEVTSRRRSWIRGLWQALTRSS